MVRRFLRDKLHIVGKAFLLALVLLFMDGMVVHAMEPIELQLTVFQKFALIDADKLPNDGSSVTYRLEPIGDKIGPLPGGASGYYEFTLSKSQSKELDAIRFTNVGIFEYKLSMVGPDKEVKGFAYDEEEFKLIVQVTRYLEDGQWKLKMEWVVMNEEGIKPEFIRYNHQYKGKKKPQTPTTPPGGDEKPGDKPNESPSEDKKPGGVISAITAPKTGDTSSPLLYLGILVLAAIGFIIIWYKKKKEQKDQE